MELDHIPTREEDDRLARMARAGDVDARNALVAGHRRLVFWAARRFARRGVPFEDLVQEGNLGLLRAVDRFDPDRGVKLSTYATPWILHSIRNALRRLTPRGSGLDLDLADWRAESPPEAADRDVVAQALRRAVDALPAREADILRLRFGLAGRRRTLHECGAILGVSGERCRQLEQRALERLRLPGTLPAA